MKKQVTAIILLSIVMLILTNYIYFRYYQSRTAIRLAREAVTLDPRRFAVESNESYINRAMEDMEGHSEIIGWRVKKIKKDNYNVSYTFSRGDKKIGYYFKVNIKNESVFNTDY